VEFKKMTDFRSVKRKKERSEISKFFFQFYTKKRLSAVLLGWSQFCIDLFCCFVSICNSQQIKKEEEDVNCIVETLKIIFSRLGKINFNN
jgi:tRNA G10  N-methylase Trm11